MTEDYKPLANSSRKPIMIEVKVARIIIDEQKLEQMITLKEKKGERLISIMIGINEAAAIRAHLSGFLPSRPMTHDLMVAIIGASGAKLEKVCIDNMVKDMFYAKLFVKISGSRDTAIIDARPSDAIALSVRLKSPIFVDKRIIAKLAK